MPAVFPAPRPVPDIHLTRDVGPDALRDRSRPPGLLRVRRGAYAVGPLPEAPWARAEFLAMAACAAAARQLGDAVLSHQSAALVLGAWVTGPSRETHVIVGSRHGTGPVDVRFHRMALPASDVMVVNGLRVTTPERTAIDCATTMPARASLPVVDSILRTLSCADRFDRASTLQRAETVRSRLLERLADRRRGRGVARARAVIAAADPLAESPGESDVRWIALAHGLPRPAAQLPVVTSSRTYYADVGWIFADPFDAGPRRVVVAEYDGAAKYSTAEGGTPLYEEKIREDSLREAGVTVHRFVARDLRDPRTAFARLCRGMPAEVVAGAAPVAALLDLPSRLRSHASQHRLG